MQYTVDNQAAPGFSVRFWPQVNVYVEFISTFFPCPSARLTFHPGCVPTSCQVWMNERMSHKYPPLQVTFAENLSGENNSTEAFPGVSKSLERHCRIEEGSPFLHIKHLVYLDCPFLSISCWVIHLLYIQGLTFWQRQPCCGLTSLIQTRKLLGAI